MLREGTLFFFKGKQGACRIQWTVQLIAMTIHRPAPRHDQLLSLGSKVGGSLILAATSLSCILSLSPLLLFVLALDSLMIILSFFFVLYVFE